MVYIFALCSLMLASCKKDNSFNLDGDCNILSLTLDEKYPAVIDQVNRTAVVQLPEIYDKSNMRLTQLTLSEGATSSVPVGAHRHNGARYGSSGNPTKHL